MAEAAILPRAGMNAGAEARAFRRRAVTLALPLGLGLFALALRLHNISHEPLWLDEGYTLLFSGLPLDRLILVGGAHEHPPLYYSLVHVIMSLHNSYLVPRYISAIAGAASVVALYALGTRLFGRIAGASAAILLAIAPFHLWYGQDGRGYEVAGLMVLLSYLFLFDALDRPRRSTWILYAAFTALAMYSEYSTAFVLFPQVLLLARARERRVQRALLLSWAGAGLAFLPWVGMLALNVSAIAGDYWIPSPTPSIVAGTGMEFFGFATPCPAWPCTGTEVGIPFLPGNEIPLAVGGLLLVAAAAFLLARGRELSLAVLFLWLTLPFVLVLLLAIGRSLYLDRTFLDATFPLYLILGLAVGTLVRLAGRASRDLFDDRRLLAGAVLGSTVVLAVASASIAGFGPIYGDTSNPDWRSAARDFQATYRPGQAVVFNPGVLRSLLSAYLPAGWHATYERPLWSRVYLDVPGWQKRYSFPTAPDKSERQREEAIVREAQLAEAARHSSRIWLITYDYSGMNDTRRWFSLHGFQCLLSELYAGDTRIELWSRDGPAALWPAVVAPASLGSWTRTGNVRIAGGSAVMSGRAELARSFALSAGSAYSVSIEYRGIPPAAKPRISARVFDASGRLLATFPRTMWYDWPVNGVWLSQPFGFVAPPGAVRATLTLTNAWGTSYWSSVGVYKER
jgi:mannosyltransferase